MCECVFVCMCVCQTLRCDCTCEKEKATSCVFKFVLLFFPLTREISPSKGPSSAGVYSSPGDPSSVKNVRCV